MKKLTVLVVIMLIVGSLAGCWLFPESKLIAIVVEPESMDLITPMGSKSAGNIESVTACYDDWTTRDIALTDCEYISSNTDVAIVNIGGDKVWILPIDSGEAVILVSYTEGKFPFKITETDIIGVLVNQ